MQFPKTEKEKENSDYFKLDPIIPFPKIYNPYSLENYSNKPKFPGYNQTFRLDTNTFNFYYNQYFDNNVYGYEQEYSLDEYLDIKKKQITNKIWDSIVKSYDLRSAFSSRDLARMLSTATGLTIPLPPNPILGIFGKPEINLNVNGEVNIRVGWRWDSQNLGTVSAYGQTQSSPIFSQDIKVNVSARVGDKIKLSTDWNTRRQFDFDNKFKIAYEGEDDDIIKLFEVGNVQLPLPTTLIRGGQALFGVRADLQFGKLFLKTIASQKRGERKFTDIKGGTSKQYFAIRAYDYAKNHFFLDTVYKTIYKEYFKYSTPIIPASASYYRIKQIEVWESTGDPRDGPNTAWGVAFADIHPILKNSGELYDPILKKEPIRAGEVERGTFMRLDSNRYKIDYNLGTLSIYNLRTDRTYAVSYRIEGPTPDRIDDLYYGDLSNTVEPKDTLILKLVYRPNLQPGFKTLWNRQMKNIYSINATNVNVKDTKIGIWYINQSNDSTDILEGAPDKLVTIMKVDQVNNNTGSPPPDGIFDLRPPFFDPYRGEITFPSIEPFRDGLREYFAKIGTPQLAERYVFNEVYDTTYEVARRNSARDRFVISGEVSGTATNRISLGAFNLAPGSVKVTLDGVPLREYEDYIIDYFSGYITLRNPRATLPNANLKIEYEQQDILNLTTKTLVGLRGDYQLFKTRTMNSNLGFTIMHYDQSALIDRVRLGEEPVANTMLGFDTKLQMEAPWLTRALDFLPFYDTKAPSSIQAQGEWAMVVPQPNKRLSEVITDNNEPVVYIDDFEGAQRYITLSLSPYQWQHSSQPIDSSIAFTEEESALYRGKMFWYQYFLPRVPIKEVYPERTTIQGRANLSPLYISFNPDQRGIYNKNPEFLDRFNPNFDSTNVFSHKPENRKRIWGGMMRLLSTFNTNFDSENIEYIEIMMKIDQWEPGNTKMYIDLGQISEDIIPNQRLDTEDGITPANPMPNNIIDPGEDVGIDALNNQQEKEQYPYPLNLENDPARDNYSFNFSKNDDLRTQEDFEYYNNFEGNATVSEMGQFPDTEILNKNNGQTISLDNSYFSYEVNLTPDPNLNPQIVGGGNNGWYLYRIPIRSPNRKVGNPLYSNIQYVRVWFKGGVFNGRIAEWRLVGSYWQRINNIQSNIPQDDSVLFVSFVNIEENSGPPDYYTMPPGVQAPKQLNDPDPTRVIRLNEQSLALKVKNLRYGDERIAVRFFRMIDIFSYKYLKFFIHGDGSMPDNIAVGSIPKAYAILRFGIDSMNYYEYRRPLLRGWQNIEIPLTQLTAIKQIRDSLMISQRMVFPVPGDPLAFFAIRGNPVLTRVQFFGLGIANPAEQYPNELTTTMWVDELRLVSPEKSVDWAGLANVEIKLADLGTINASITNTQPNFHMLEDRFGNRSNTTNWSVTMLGNLEKFAPKSFSEMKIPISYSHSEYTEVPQFVANSDVNLEQAANASAAKAKEQALQQGLSEEEAEKIAIATRDNVRTRSQTLRITDSWAITGFKLGLPTSFWLIRDTFNRLVLGYSYSQEYERNPIVEQKFSWIWQFTGQYSISINELITLKPLTWSNEVPIIKNYSDWKINFLPSNFSAGLNLSRRRTTEKSRFLEFPSPVFRDFSAQKQAQFQWKLSENGFLNPLIDYSLNSNSTLVPLELDENGRQRSASQLASKIFFNEGLINLGTENQYNQNLTINFKPRLPIADVNKYMDITGSYGTIYNWINPLQPDPQIANIAKSASYQNTIRINTSIKLKTLADNWFGTEQTPKPVSPIPPQTTDSTSKSSSTFFSSVGNIFKTIFLDFDKFDINFNQTNSSNNPGVFGGTGITNFWARGLTGRSSELIWGPCFAYQLGLISSPHGGFYIVRSSKFPFFGFQTYPGLRPPNAILQDNFNQRTTLELKTTRPLWEGATLDLNWRSELAFNKNQTVLTDSFGIPTFTNIMAMESFNRTFLSFPSFFGLNIFNNNIEHIIELFEARKAQILASDKDTVQKNQEVLYALAESFYDGLEAFTIFGGKVGKFLPAINWAIRWEGIEKWDIFNGFAKRISFEHVYSSKYTESAMITDNGKEIQNQQVQNGFQPLFGITMSFDEKKVGGILTATLRWSSTNTFQLNSANRSTVSRQSTEEIQAQASYTMKEFEFPLFGLSLKNDVEFSFLASFKKNKRATYDISGTEYYGGKDGRTLDGSTQITIEPRARYVVSDRVSASFFIRYEGTFNEGAASPGYHTIQTGFDIRISIAGGR